MPADDVVTIRYPLRFRVIMSLCCAAAVIYLLQPPVEAKNLVVGIGAFWLDACFLSYRIDVSRAEVRVRRIPFLTRVFRTAEIVQILEGLTLVLVTRTKKIPLWNLTNETRQRLSEVLPEHVPTVSASTGAPSPSATFQKWRRRTIYLGVSFVVATGAVAAFLEGAPLHKYWNQIGVPVLFLWVFLAWALIYTAGTTYNFWSYMRNMRKIENHPAARHPKRRN